jgi:hypothetical protein
MSLRKKTTMTQEKIAANQANGRRSHGPATPQGRERIRAANTRHGFYSQAEAVALACLGEDAAELERLRQNLHDDWQPPSGLEEELVEHLVQVVWRWKRAGRMQEGFALRQAKDVNLTREDRLHAHMMRLKMTEESLRLLVQSVAREYYVTTSADLEKMKSLHQEGVMKEMGEIALALFYRLEEPGEKDEHGRRIDPQEAGRRVLVRIKEIFGLSSDFAPKANVAPGSSQPPGSQQGAGATPGSQQDAQAGVAPDFSPAPADPSRCSGQALKVGAAQPAAAEGPPSRFTPAEWEARERARQLLENLLTRQVEIYEAQRKAILKESLAGPSPFERAAEIALAHPNAALMQRMGESSFRQIWRITNLLLKIKRQGREAESWENPARGQNVHENTAA